MALPTDVTIVEVGPRDGLQNESTPVSTAVKVEFIDRLAGVGLRVVEAASFVNPKWVPQMADAAEVMAGITRQAGVRYPVLVPNERGLNGALAANAGEVAVFGAASEAFSKKNINRTIGESIEMFRPVVTRAKAEGLRVRGYVSTVLGCPYQGDVPTSDVLRMTESMLALGVDEVSLGDTIGVGTPGATANLIDELRAVADLGLLAVHMHDTYGQGLANTLAALHEGITVADASSGGLGGCPYAPGAKGNLATEDLVYALHGSGVETGVDLDALIDVSGWMAGHLGRPSPSRVVEAVLAKRARSADA